MHLNDREIEQYVREPALRAFYGGHVAACGTCFLKVDALLDASASELPEARSRQ